MAAIPRKTQLLLGGAITNPAGLVEGPAGSYAGGSPTYSLDPAVIQNVAGGSGSAWLQGFLQMLIQTGGGVNSPAYQTLQAILLVITQQLGYLLERGIPEWDSTGNTPYYLYDICAVAGVLYQVTAAGPVGTTSPVTDTNNWKVFISATPPAASIFGWARINGITSTITASHNVSSLYKNSTGNYQITWATAIPGYASYQLSCARATTGYGSAGEICTRFNGDVFNGTQFQFRVIDAGNQTPLDSSEVCVLMLST